MKLKNKKNKPSRPVSDIILNKSEFASLLLFANTDKFEYLFVRENLSNAYWWEPIPDPIKGFSKKLL